VIISILYYTAGHLLVVCNKGLLNSSKDTLKASACFRYVSIAQMVWSLCVLLIVPQSFIEWLEHFFFPPVVCVIYSFDLYLGTNSYLEVQSELRKSAPNVNISKFDFRCFLHLFTLNCEWPFAYSVGQLLDRLTTSSCVFLISCRPYFEPHVRQKFVPCDCTFHMSIPADIPLWCDYHSHN
jgi:hypothetical protein